jgi:predicted dehydrogenase
VGLRLGLLSTARINDAILRAAAATEAVDVVAVGGRDAERTRAYAAAKGIPVAHHGYEALLADDDIDAVYVSAPNGLHVEWSVRALQAGRHVLCEKPLTRDPAQAERAFDAADAAGRILAEAFMWRHNPQTARLLRLLEDGAVGEVRLVRAAFSFPLRREGDPRLDAALDGGALMDVGCYCVSGARLVAGEPLEVSAMQVPASGVDLRLAATMRHAGGVLTTLDCAFDLPDRAELEVAGSAGVVTLRDPWHARSGELELVRDGEREVVAVEPADSYRLQLENFAAAAAGEAAPLLGREDALGQARAIAAIQASAGEGGRPVAL